MGYIKSKDHFINYLNRVANGEQEIDATKLLSAQFYIEEIYQPGFADNYTWALKSKGAHLLEDKHALEWLADQRKQSIGEFGFDHSFTPEFRELLDDLENVCGAYCFLDRDKSPVYVGRSIRLGQRMVSSFKRFLNYDRPVYIKYIQTNSAPDAAILELYFISKFNPPFNRQDNFSSEELTLTIAPIPEWSEPIRCNIIVYEETNHGP